MEKLANHIALQSIAEGGMEKQALNTAQLLRMGRNFALRGKIDRFNKLLDRRAQAASKVFDSRWNAWEDAANTNMPMEDYLTYDDVNPVALKAKTAWKRIPGDPIKIPRDTNHLDRETVDADAANALYELLRDNTGIREGLSDAMLSNTPKYNSDQLATFSRALRNTDPKLHKKVLTTGSFK